MSEKAMIIPAEKYISPERFDMELFRKRNVLSEEDNECLVETAGFEPLDVKLYKMYQAGIQARANVDMLDINDYRDIYLNPDFSYDEDMDIEEIQEIERMRSEFIAQIQAKKEKEEDNSLNLSEEEKKKFSAYFKEHMAEFREQLNSAAEDKSKADKQPHAE